MNKTKTIVGYKGFNDQWKCQNKQYEVGKSTTHKGTVKLCSSGLHFCENPFDVLNYYPLIGSKFAIIEATGVTGETENDSKRVARSLTIKTELNLEGFIKAGFKFIFAVPTAPPAATVPTAPPVATVPTEPPVATMPTAPPVATVPTAPPVATVPTAPPAA
jgi:hypothetical protein